MAIRLVRSNVIPSEGFTHGFPERTGGVSVGLRASLNLGVPFPRNPLTPKPKQTFPHVPFTLSDMLCLK